MHHWIRGALFVLPLLIATIVAPARSGEWIAHHDLILPPDAPSLGDVNPPSAVFLPGPATPADHDAWAANLDAWRKRARNELGWRGKANPDPNVPWTGHAVTQDQVVIWDRSLFDARTGQYTVDHFLADAEGRAGPLDAVLLWPTYPNLGVDERNQFDLLHDVPGGVAGMRGLIATFHARGVNVLLPYLAWDTGTRAEPATPALTMARFAAAVDADGVNFDGLDSVPEMFYQSAAALGPPLALERLRKRFGERPDFLLHGSALDRDIHVHPL